MATRAFAVDINAAGVSYDGTRSGDLAGNLPATTALDAAMATLVADGATPTQAHVTTANSALTTYKAALAAAITAQSHDMILAYSNTNLSDRGKVQNAFNVIRDLIAGTGV